MLVSLLEFVVTEGLARWQLATGESFLEGAVQRLGPVVVWLSLPYLVLTWRGASRRGHACDSWRMPH